VTLSRGGRVAGLVALALLASGQGCGGGGGDGGSVPQETRTFDFTVTVAGASQQLSNVAFFQDSGLQNSGVRVESESEVKATPPATVLGQQPVSAMPSGFNLTAHFDGSGSMARADPSQDRFRAADTMIARVGEVAASTPTRLYTFRFIDGDTEFGTKRFRLNAGPFDAGNAAARSAGITASQDEERGNSPALSATFNIIGSGGGENGSLPSGPDHAMLLLTDGENNREDQNIIPNCTTGEEGGGTSSGCGNTTPVRTRAADRKTRIFVAGFGNNDTALGKFRTLAGNTGGAFLKVTRAGELQRQFRNVADLLTLGGRVVNARTSEVTVNLGGDPFVRGWMRFNKIGGNCPGGSVSHDASTCKIEF
jgi:hypothetical protein